MIGRTLSGKKADPDREISLTEVGMLRIFQGKKDLFKGIPYSDKAKRRAKGRRAKAARKANRG